MIANDWPGWARELRALADALDSGEPSYEDRLIAMHCRRVRVIIEVKGRTLMDLPLNQAALACHLAGGETVPIGPNTRLAIWADPDLVLRFKEDAP